MRLHLTHETTILLLTALLYSVYDGLFLIELSNSTVEHMDLVLERTYICLQRLEPVCHSLPIKRSFESKRPSSA